MRHARNIISVIPLCCDWLVFNEELRKLTYDNHKKSLHLFYHAMHFSAKRGIAIACRLSVRLSVRPSVTLVNCDHIYRLEIFENNFTFS